MNSVNILEYFYKDGVFIQNQTVLPNKGAGGHPWSKRASEAEEERSAERGRSCSQGAPCGVGAVLISLRQTWVRFPR